MSPPIDWTLVGRYALLVSLAQLVPVPVLDRHVENLLRRRMVGALLARHGLTLSDEDLATLADTPGGGCMGCLWGVVLWPFRKLLRAVLFVFQVKNLADVASDVAHRALLLEEAIDQGWLPDRIARVRAAMDRTLDKVDTRVAERAVAGVYRDHREDLNRAVHDATRAGREQARQRASELADAAEGEGLGPVGEETSRALAAAIQASGVSDEVIHWFRAEMARPEPEPEPGSGTTAG